MYDVVLVDDQVLFVESLRTVIQSRAEDFSIVGVFYDGETAIRSVPDLKPDLVLMDVRMPGTDGVQATRRILERSAGTKVVMLTTYEEDDYVRQAVKQGAIGYLLKDMPPDALLACMRSAISGQFQIPSKFAMQFLDVASVSDSLSSPAQSLDHKADPDHDAHMGDPVQSSRVATEDLPDWLYELSRKERMILRLIIEGHENHEIAERVYLAPQTVKNYVSKLYAKADVDSRSHLIKISRQYLGYL
jgi:DNA-binding NarL/FixJ family response regulator